MPISDPVERPTPYWWERRGVLIALVLLAAAPLLWPALPPLTDLPGHMGRWHIAMAIGESGGGSAALSRYYGYVWAPIGNLGMDLLVPAIARAMPFELAAKIGVMLIPMLTVVGLLWSARETHGRVPPTAMFALPLAYAWPFQLGFVNFALAQALAFCAFGLWLRWGHTERLRMRAVVFAGIACVLWIAHSFGWGMFGLMAAGAELARRRGQGERWNRSAFGAFIQCLPLTLPGVFMIATLHGHDSGAGTGLGADDWFDVGRKALWMVSILRDRWEMVDILSLGPIIMLFYAAARSPTLGFSAMLGWPALLCLAAFVMLPRLLLGGAYVDMRMIPAAAMLGLIAIAPPRGGVRMTRALATMALAFVLIRTIGTTASFAIRAGEQQRELAAIEAIPRNASVLALTARPCGGVWTDLRRDHLAGLAIVRRDVFINEQWALAGQQLLRIRHLAAAPYLSDPSQLVYPRVCPDIGSRFATAIAGFPRAGFEYVWTIGFPPGAARARDLALVWSNGGSALYRVVQ